MPNNKFEYNASAFSILTHRLAKYAKRSRHPKKVVRVPFAQLTLHSLNPLSLPPPPHPS